MAYRVDPPPHKKYARELLAQLPKGYKIGIVRETGGHTFESKLVSKGHPLVVTPDGDLLRSADGRPVSVCGTPGSPHSFKNDLRLIRRAIEGVR